MQPERDVGRRAKPSGDGDRTRSNSAAVSHTNSCRHEKEERNRRVCVRRARVAGGAERSEGRVDRRGGEPDVARAHGEEVLELRRDRVSEVKQRPGGEVAHFFTGCPSANITGGGRDMSLRGI